MTAGKDWLDLIVVTCAALGFITLMLAIQGAQHGRSRRQIVGTIALLWGAVALTLGLAWLLEDHWGGSLIDVQITPEPEVITRPVTSEQAVVLGLFGVVLLAAYITVILAVRRLMQPADRLMVRTEDGAGSEEE
ncbi:MAG: hypothetical protein ACOCX2_15210 [Armatimonadota bacterium]